MPLLSAIADLSERSLASLSSVWEKLAFLAELRGSDGVYRHWGLEGVHGQQETASALSAAHAELIETLASSRFSELWRDAHEAAEHEGNDPASVIALVRAGHPKAFEMHGVPAEHFEFE